MVSLSQFLAGPAASASKGFVTDSTFDQAAETLNLPLDATLVCVATASIKRRLLDRLNRIHDIPSDALPEVVTFGELFERLYEPPLPIASDAERSLGWVQTLRDARGDELEPLVVQRPDDASLEDWLHLAGILVRLYDDVAASGRTFADMAHEVDAADRSRWETFAKLETGYHAALKRAGRIDAGRARRDACDNANCRCDRTIVLAGTTDLPASIISMLQTLSGDIRCAIAAPPDRADGFDPWGCVRRDHWSNAKLPIADEHLLPADDVESQCELAVNQILSPIDSDGDEPPSTEPHETPKASALVVTDESLVAPLEFACFGQNVATHRELGYRVEETSVGKFLQLCRDAVHDQDWESFAAAARHPAIAKWLVDKLIAETSEDFGDASASAEDILLTRLDRLRATHFPQSIDEDLPQTVDASLRPLLPLARSWVALLRSHLAEGQSWANHCNGWRKLLKIFYPEIHDAADRTIHAFQACKTALDGQSEIAGELDPQVDLAASTGFLVDQLLSLRIRETSHDNDIPIAGWLDAGSLTQPSIVVVGLNHPYLPESVTADAFLPGTLRGRLRIVDNERRYARDAHLLQCLIEGHRHVRFIVGKTSLDESPTPPSRLIAAAPATDVARRIRHLMAPGDAESMRTGSRQRRHRWDHATASGIAIPDLDRCRVGPVTAMSVTSFKTYLACPYRFFLRHRLHLKPIDDAAEELAANQFGDLVHDTLEAFGKGPKANATGASTIESELHRVVEETASQRYGKRPSPAIAFQIESAKRRLSEVAVRQSERAAEGWRIHDAEAVLEGDDVAIEVDGHRMPIRGRIDRIDFHPATNRYAILDYKTHGRPPTKEHLATDANGQTVWKDLQLPLYRRLVPHLLPSVDPASVDVGYFNIGNRAEETEIRLAEFSEQQYHDAYQIIDQIIRDVISGRFEPADQPPDFDDYAMILQTNVFRPTVSEMSEPSRSLGTESLELEAESIHG